MNLIVLTIIILAAAIAAAAWLGGRAIERMFDEWEGKK